MEEEMRLRDAQSWHAEKRIEETVRALTKNNMEAIYVKDKKSALDEILKRIPKSAVVSHGGSYTLRELGIIEILEKGEYQYERRSPVPGSRDSRLDFSSDVYLTSVNAITLDGELIAMDGIGNRVACLLFGPKKVLVIAGKNKIVNTLENGIARIKNYVAPVHAKRRNWDIPCAKEGKCVDCKSQGRMCNKLAVLQYEPNKDRVSVIIVGEELGI